VTPIDAGTPYDDRRARVREAMDELGCDALVLVTPENIHYLTGLDHQGHFAFTALVLPRHGEPRMVAREMERPTVRDQVVGCAFQGYADGNDPGVVTAVAIGAVGPVTRIGTELASMCLPPLVWESLRRGLPHVEWTDCSPAVSWIRAIKSPAEIACMRAAAAMSDAAVLAGITRATEGVPQGDIAAECYHAMLRAGSEYPACGPLIRSGEQLSQEHVTWGHRPLRHAEAMLIELSGAVQRYHAPLTRVVHVGVMTPGAEETAKVALGAEAAVVEALRPGVPAEQVYQAWQAVVDDALGRGRYSRHHCGYLVGSGFPPSWVGGSVVQGLRPGSDLVVQAGMTFHLLSWILADGLPPYAVSDTALVTAQGCELLTTASREPRIVH